MCGEGTELHVSLQWERPVCVLSTYSGALVASCYESSVACKAVCICDTGFGGAYCSISSEDLSLLYETRQTALSALRTITDSDERAFGSVVSWLSALNSLTLQLRERNGTAASVIESVVLTVLSSAMQIELDYELIADVLRNMDVSSSLTFVETTMLMQPRFARS